MVSIAPEGIKFIAVLLPQPPAYRDLTGRQLIPESVITKATLFVGEVCCKSILSSLYTFLLLDWQSKQAVYKSQME